METHKVKALLDKYWNGQSSPEEEKRLRAYFQDPPGPLPEEWRMISAYFRTTGQLAEARPGKDFDARLEEKLVSIGSSGPVRTLPIRAWAAAATVAALIAASWWFSSQPATVSPQKQAIDWSQYEPDSPEEAFRITRQALGFSARKLEYGTSRAMSGVNRLQEITRHVQ